LLRHGLRVSSRYTEQFHNNESELLNWVADKFDVVCWRTCYSQLTTAILYHANVVTMLALS